MLHMINLFEYTGRDQLVCHLCNHYPLQYHFLQSLARAWESKNIVLDIIKRFLQIIFLFFSEAKIFRSKSSTFHAIRTISIKKKIVIMILEWRNHKRIVIYWNNKWLPTKIAYYIITHNNELAGLASDNWLITLHWLVSVY